MSHSICGFNKIGEEIAYVDFNYRNSVAATLYSIFDAYEYHAGMSGSGESEDYSLQQVEKALEKYKEIFKNHPISESDEGPDAWYQKQVLNFVQKCLETAQTEGNVRVSFA